VEHRADDITHKAFARLHTQFITRSTGPRSPAPLPIDDVLDLADAAAERIGLYDIDQVLPEARDLATVLVAQRRRCRRRWGPAQHEEDRAPSSRRARR